MTVELIYNYATFDKFCGILHDVPASYYLLALGKFTSKNWVVSREVTNVKIGDHGTILTNHVLETWLATGFKV